MTIIYLMRHSEPLKWNNVSNSDDLQMQNEKWPLTENGELIAKDKLKNSELNSFDMVFSSKYVRAISTAKYFTNDKVNIIEEFGERKFGIDSWDELPENFSKKQFIDFDYKIKNGESLNDVIKREVQMLDEILDNYNGKKILIVGHLTAYVALLSKWCDVSPTGSYMFNGVES